MANQRKLTRRETIKLLGAATSASLLASLPSKWSKPEVTGSVIPAHAQTSCPDITGQYTAYDDDDVDPSYTVTVTRNGDIYTVLWHDVDPPNDLDYSGNDGIFDCTTLTITYNQEGGSDTGIQKMTLQQDGSLFGPYDGNTTGTETWIPM